MRADWISHFLILNTYASGQSEQNRSQYISPAVIGGSFQMSSYQTLSMIHLGTGLLLLHLAVLSIVLSVLIAVKPAVDHANSALLKSANAVSLLEQLSLGAVTVTGLVAALLKSLPLSQPWLWMSLTIVVFYGLALRFMTKPARLAVVEGGSMIKVGMQVGLQVGHVLLLIVAFALMLIKPV
jgi:hypothetical protein